MQRDAKTGTSFKCGHNAMESQSEKTAIECENVLLTNMNVLILQEVMFVLWQLYIFHLSCEVSLNASSHIWKEQGYTTTFGFLIFSQTAADAKQSMRRGTI